MLVFVSMSVCLHVCMSVCLYVCTSVCLHVCMYVLCTCTCMCMTICLLVRTWLNVLSTSPRSPNHYLEDPASATWKCSQAPRGSGPWIGLTSCGHFGFTSCPTLRMVVVSVWTVWRFMLYRFAALLF